MRYLSAEFTNRLASNSTLTAKATVRFADGTSRELAGEDFCSLSVEQASSSSGSFDIGAAVVGQLTCALNNYDDRFSECDFEGAAMTVWVGATLPSGNEEWVKLGVYYVDRPDSYAGQVSLTALDCLSLLEKDYSQSTFSSWPKTLQQIADAGCLACGLMNDTTEIPNGSYSVASEPELDDATWLDVMGYVAQATGTFVRATDDGHVEFAWYDTSAFESEDWNDGGSFDSASPYATGDTADGGNFTDYSSGDSMDGGEFSTVRRLGVVNHFSSLTVFTDDVVITGVSVTAQNQVIRNSDGSESNGEDGETALYGSEGYVLSLADNPLVLYGQAAKVASQVGKRVVGMSLRPFSCDAVTDPSIEPGDAVLVYDRKGNEYRSYVTSTNMKVNGSETIECGAQSTSRHSAESASAATKAIVKARNDLNREKTSRQKAIEDLTEKISESSGLFSTTVTLPDGSSIVYLHDKSDLQSSKIVWKMTAEAVAVSTNGPEGPYATGLTADGTAILNRIYAVGINADYISDGALEDGTGKNYWNLKTGELRMTGYAKDSETISSVDVEYAQNQSATTAPTSGWQTTAPAYKSGYYIWSRTKTVNADGTASYSTPVMISGRDGADGADGKSPTATVVKSGTVSTITITNADGTVTKATVNDGTNGTKGANGYVHVKYSDDGGKTFTGNSGEDPGKYIGVYTDNTEADSTKVSTYTWSLVKGADGEDGIGVSAIVEQYYLSTSKTAQSGGSWSETQPAYVSGRYYWTRSKVTWTDGQVTYTTPVLAQGVNNANEEAKKANDAVTTLDEALDQEEVLNRLTNGSKEQGIYLENGKLYINGTYIKSGTVDAGLLKAGKLLVTNKTTGATVFYADIDAGTCYIGGDSVKIGGSTLTDKTSELESGQAALEAKYGVCSIAAATAAKTVSITGFVLKKGATVNVRFYYANTASSPTLNVNGTGAKSIAYAGNSYLNEKYYWKAGALLTFTYDGSYWQLADGGSRKDARSIWASDTSAVTVSAGTITFNSDTFVVNSTYFSVTAKGVITATSGTIGGFTITSSAIKNEVLSLQSNGMHFIYDSTDIGRVGTNSLAASSTSYGLTFNLNYEGTYMAWSAEKSSSSATYTLVWFYANREIKGSSGYTYDAGQLHAGCNINLNGNGIVDAKIQQDCWVAGGLDASDNIVLTAAGGGTYTVKIWHGFVLST